MTLTVHQYLDARDRASECINSLDVLVADLNAHFAKDIEDAWKWRKYREMLGSAHGPYGCSVMLEALLPNGQLYHFRKIGDLNPRDLRRFANLMAEFERDVVRGVEAVMDARAQITVTRGEEG